MELALVGIEGHSGVDNRAGVSSCTAVSVERDEYQW